MGKELQKVAKTLKTAKTLKSQAADKIKGEKEATKEGMEAAKEAATEALTKKKKADMSGCKSDAQAAAKASEVAKKQLANVEAREVKLAKLVTDEQTVRKVEKDAE